MKHFDIRSNQAAAVAKRKNRAPRLKDLKNLKADSPRIMKVQEMT